MTYEEAIKHLSEGWNGDAYNGSFVAIEMAIEALEKQISKKPTMKPDTAYLSGFQPICANCGAEDIDTDELSLKYCWHCGQAIDWSDND